VSRHRNRPQPGDPLTPEQAAKGYRVIRSYVLCAVITMWLIVVLDAGWLHEGVAVLVGLAVIYSLVAPVLLRYLKADLDNRVVGSADRPHMR
jgi:hypothetical protein